MSQTCYAVQQPFHQHAHQFDDCGATAIPKLSGQPQLIDVHNANVNCSNGQSHPTAVHWAKCDACTVEPIQGTRWRCLTCAEFDLCFDCLNFRVHDHHRFEEIPPMSETHVDVFCKGCDEGDTRRSLLGPRYICQVHNDENWCRRCISAGKTCGGPYTVVRQTPTAMQLEAESCLPIPHEWMPFLRPVLASYNNGGGEGHCDYPPGLALPYYLRTPATQNWHNIPKRERWDQPATPVYRVSSEFKKGRLGRDNKYTWSLSENHNKRASYTYAQRMHSKTNKTISTVFTSTAKGAKDITPIFRQHGTHDTLTFHDPSNSSVLYTWRSNRPISTLNNERFDFQRNALFRTRAGKELLVADWAWWDGHSTSPEDCLSIRDADVPHSLVLAALLLLLGTHTDVMIEEWRRDPAGAKATQNTALLTPKGAWSHGEEEVEDVKPIKEEPPKQKEKWEWKDKMEFDMGF